MRAATGATIGSDFGLIDIFPAISPVEDTEPEQCLHNMSRISPMGSSAHLILTLAPSPHIIANADGAHASQRGVALLKVGIVATTGEMACRTDYERMLAAIGGRVDSATDKMIVDREHTEILAKIAIVATDTAERRLQRRAPCKQRVDAEPLSDLRYQRVPPGFPLTSIGIETCEPLQKLTAVIGGTAWVFIVFDLIIVVILLNRLEIERRKNILERLVERVGTDAEVGIREHEPGRIDIGALEPHVELRLDILNHIGERALKMVSIRLSNGH